MAQPLGKLATYEDLRLLDPQLRAQILSGAIISAPAPLPRHSKSQGSLRRFIGGPFDDDDGFGGPGGWWIFVEVDVQLGPHDIVRPDLAGWRRERLPQPGAVRPITITPNWVCEVLSPSTAAIDRVAKRALYGHHGVEDYWLLDPEARTLEALQLQDGRWLELGAWSDDNTARIPPFEEIELDLRRLFLPSEADPARRSEG